MFYCNLFAPRQETFADAGDGNGGRDRLGQFFVTRTATNMFSKLRKFQKFDKSKNISLNMFIYSENDTESHRITQNINI